MRDLDVMKAEVAKVTSPYICQRLRDKSKADKEPSAMLAWLRPKLVKMANDINFTVEFDNPRKILSPYQNRKMEGELHGICDQKTREIIIDPHRPHDFVTRCLVHELSHAMGVHSRHDGNDEVAAETIAWQVCKQLGYDAFDWSMPQVAVSHWMMGGRFQDHRIEHYTDRILNSL